VDARPEVLQRLFLLVAETDADRMLGGGHAVIEAARRGRSVVRFLGDHQQRNTERLHACIGIVVIFSPMYSEPPS